MRTCPKDSLEWSPVVMDKDTDIWYISIQMPNSATVCIPVSQTLTIIDRTLDSNGVWLSRQPASIGW